MDKAQLTTLLPNIVDLAERAGSRILEVKREALKAVDYKADASPVTLADRAAHEIILAGLTDLAPEIPVLSEEGELEAVQTRIASQPDGLYWLVDPLDGTKEFIKENGEYTVNIALVQRGTPILGVIHPPEHDVTYWAIQGQGAHKRVGQASPIRIQANDQPRKLKVVASRSHFSADTQAFIDRLSEQFGEVELVQRGSSIKICAVAEGSADVYPRLGPTMLWDTGAGCIIAREAGCLALDLSGEELTYRPEGDLRKAGFLVCSARMEGLAGHARGALAT